jgi:hypothetical protein
MSTFSPYCVYQRVLANQERAERRLASKPIYHGNKIWGNTFCEAMKVVLASYNFVVQENGGALPHVYVSYEHPGDDQYRGKANHPPCNCMRPAKTIRVKHKYSLCVVLEVYARKDESPPPPCSNQYRF